MGKPKKSYGDGSGRAVVFITLGSIQMRAGALADAEANLKKPNPLIPPIVPLMMLGAFYQQQRRGRKQNMSLSRP